MSKTSDETKLSTQPGFYERGTAILEACLASAVVMHTSIGVARINGGPEFPTIGVTINKTFCPFSVDELNKLCWFLRARERDGNFSPFVRTILGTIAGRLESEAANAQTAFDDGRARFHH